MTRMDLPRWVIDDAQSVREECAPYIAMSPEQRMAVLAALLEDAARILAARDDAARALAWVDPLPESSVRALSRLRERERRRSPR